VFASCQRKAAGVQRSRIDPGQQQRTAIAQIDHRATGDRRGRCLHVGEGRDGAIVILPEDVGAAIIVEITSALDVPRRLFCPCWTGSGCFIIDGTRCTARRSDGCGGVDAGSRKLPTGAGPATRCPSVSARSPSSSSTASGIRSIQPTRMSAPAKPRLARRRGHATFGRQNAE
jgi:hypothetical protein